MPAMPATAIALHRGLNLLSLTIASLWVIGFSFWFRGFELPNNQVPRWMIWESIPYDVMDLVDPPVKKGEAPWSWFYLFQRLPFISIAALVWLAAWGHGSLALRILGIRLRGMERFFFAVCTGLSIVSLVMLGMGLCGILSRWPLMTVLVMPCLIEGLLQSRDRHAGSSPVMPMTVHRELQPRGVRFGRLIAVVLALFVIGQMLGAMTPQTDFDVVEYHLGGPKEWFQQGQIVRLPHNVYTSFPFLSEMLILSGMVLYGDWQWGALAGQAVTAGFAPLTAIGLFAAGRRWFSAGAGWLAAFVYLTSPWTYRISIIAYAEGGLACYLFAAIHATLLFRDEVHVSKPGFKQSWATFALLSGLMAGSAMACKYTGLVSVVIPNGLFLIWIAARQGRQVDIRHIAVSFFCFAVGVGATIGPWLLKNSIETGNPVYPLAVRVFGGIDRDPELDAKWVRAHAAKMYPSWKDRLNDLPVKVTDVVANNDWHSPLMFALAPLSLFWCRRRNGANSTDSVLQSARLAIVGIGWLYVGWQFLSWWLLTHHIDRFYVPMFSSVALLAGIGVRWWESEPDDRPANRGLRIWRCVAGLTVVASTLYNADIMIHSEISGFNAGRMDLSAADEIAVAPRLKWLNDEYASGRIAPDAKVLCVGEALMFHARYPYFYNTVFNHSLLEQICADPSSTEHRWRPADEIRAELHRRGITLIDVNWMEILRYREPGNYGYTDFVHPSRFEDLQRMGILGPALSLPPTLSLAPLDIDLQKRLMKWAPELITSFEGKPAYFKAQVFPVLELNEAADRRE